MTMTGFLSRLACPAGHGGQAGQAAKAPAQTAARNGCRAGLPHRNSQARRELLTLNGHILNDIGLSRWEIETLS
jgi:uncharacterized protein YjiS (DUF1127 family)